MFLKYPKIYRLGTEETDGILDGPCYVQEKIDGANASIWMEKGKICCGSRNNKLTRDVHNQKEGDNGFNGFLDFVKNHDGIRKLFIDYPESRLYGEWLVKHTIQYNETAYKQFYLFDVMENEKLLSQIPVGNMAEMYDIASPQIFGKFGIWNLEDIKKLVGETNIGEKGEGVVIKNPKFINKFDESRYAKVVSEKFKEDSAVVFGGNAKHSDTYWEQYVVNKYMNLARVRKIIQKIESSEGRIKIEHTPRVIATSYHDMITEEVWEIFKKVPKIDTKALSRISQKKARQIFHDILNDSLSATDTQ